MEVNRSNKKSEKERKQKVFTSHLLQITLQQKAGRGVGWCRNKRLFCLQTHQGSAFLRSLVSAARHIPGKGLGAFFLLPNDTQALSPGRTAFSLQG